MKVVIVDDHPLIRKGIAELVTIEDSMEVVGEASDYTEGLNRIIELKPDLAIVDLRLAGKSGLALVKECREKGVNSKFTILTSSSNQQDFNQAKQVGVDGYILKEALPEELLHALKVIGKGRKYFDPGVLELMTNEVEEDEFIEHLTPKEKEVLIELGKGMSNRDISERLFVTEYTVKKHVSQILAKLELTDRTQAALYANAKGLVSYAIN
ncbi:response regulator [Chungangia koreensis]|uniref:Response regulator n=1 Tax=Chungangia koreensis TaxID=752657 RepID=A0ABV8X469_9LACT